MEYRTLGRSGLKVSPLCLGTMMFGGPTDEETARRIIDRAADQGVNFIDTADVYEKGRSEEIVGRWLKARPEAARRMVVATKGRFPMGPGPNDVGLSRRHLTHALDASLRRLGVEVVDLYQTHAWDALTPVEETLRFLTSLFEQVVQGVAEGRGLTPEQVRAAVDAAPLLGPAALEAKLVDGLLYRDEVYADVRKRAGGDDVELLFADQWTPRRKPAAMLRRHRDRVALVEGHGSIVVGRSRSTLQGSRMGSATVCAALRWWWAAIVSIVPSSSTSPWAIGLQASVTTPFASCQARSSSCWR